MAYIRNIFHYYDTFSLFKEHLDSNLIDPDSICFIGDKGQIYTQGRLFCLDKTEFDSILKVVNEHTIKLNNILGIDGPSTETTELDNLIDVYNFLSGYKTDESLKEVLDSIETTISKQVTEVEKSLLEEISNTKNNLENTISKISQLCTENTNDIELLKREELTIKQDIKGLTENIEYYGAALDKLTEYIGSTANSLRTDIKGLTEKVSSLNNIVSNNSESILSISESVQSILSKIENLEEFPTISEDFIVKDNTLFINKITKSDLQLILN